MNLIILVWNYLKARPLNTAINIILLALGIAVIAILLLFNRQLEEKITDNARGIDLVVGAKGSPLQLILCNIFHIDFPTGNIKLAEAERIARNRLVKKAIPLALGDSYQSYRIVGTSQAYAELYKATLAQGAWWKKDLEVTIGANVARLAGLKPGDTFASAHGLTEGGHDHDEHKFVVTGMETIKRSEVHRYRFPEQEHGVRLRPQPVDPDTEKNVNVFEIAAEHLLLKRAKGSPAPHPLALVPGKPIATKVAGRQPVCAR